MCPAETGLIERGGGPIILLDLVRMIYRMRGVVMPVELPLQWQ